MMLSEAERGRFILYLEEVARDNEALAQHMEALAPPLAKKYRAETLACKVVAAMLRSTEACSLGDPRG